MSKWELVGEVKDTGYYIGWHRMHKEIHLPNPIEPMSKNSLVQIGGRDGYYQVGSITYAHSIFHPQEKGLKLFERYYYFPTLPQARKMATRLKKEIAQKFDRVTSAD